MSLTNKLIKPWKSQDQERDKVIKYKSQNTIITEKGIFKDLSSLSFQCSFGFENKVIKNEIEKQLKLDLLSYSKFYLQMQEDSASTLLETLNLNGHIFFTLSGAESIENALKICRDFSKRKIILSRKKSYHGATLGALQITGDWRRKVSFMPRIGHNWLPEPDDDPDFSKSLKVIEKIGPENIAAICLESITAKNGGFVLPQPWITGMKKLQRHNQIKIIFDETVCGFYRTGKAFGFQHYDITPDVVCMGKAISNGMAPLGAVYFNKKIIRKYRNTPFMSGLTNYAHPLSLAAFNGVSKYINSAIFQKRMISNESIVDKWIRKVRPIVKDIRGRGFLFAIELKRDIPPNYFESNGINISTNHNMIILCPVISMSSANLKKDLKLLMHSIEGLV